MNNDNPVLAEIVDLLAGYEAQRLAAAAAITDADIADVIRQVALKAADRDEVALHRIVNAGPSMRPLLEGELNAILEERKAALEARRHQVGPAVAVDASRVQYSPDSIPELETAPAATTPTPTAYVTIEIDYSGRPPRPVAPPQFTARRYGLVETPRRERTGWMWNR
jgi:hypothetical protein